MSACYLAGAQEEPQADGPGFCVIGYILSVFKNAVQASGDT